MAGSYNHCVSDSGQLLSNESFVEMIENLGDAYEAVEEMYGMIWLLAAGEPSVVEEARQRYMRGLELSPGVENED